MTLGFSCKDHVVKVKTQTVNLKALNVVI